jgi:hypothetical protein
MPIKCPRCGYTRADNQLSCYVCLVASEKKDHPRFLSARFPSGLPRESDRIIPHGGLFAEELADLRDQARFEQSMDDFHYNEPLPIPIEDK